jgi:hypothetical protein
MMPSMLIDFLDDNGQPRTASQKEPLPVSIVESIGPRSSAISLSMVQAIDGAFALKPSGAVLFATSNYASQAAESSKSVKASNGVIYGIGGYNAKASAQFIQIHDASSIPADGAIPAFSITAAASSNFSIDFGVYGMAFLNGLAVSNSSTVATKTVGAADCNFYIRYK